MDSLSRIAMIVFMLSSLGMSVVSFTIARRRWDRYSEEGARRMRQATVAYGLVGGLGYPFAAVLLAIGRPEHAIWALPLGALFALLAAAGGVVALRRKAIDPARRAELESLENWWRLSKLIALPLAGLGVMLILVVGFTQSWLHGLTLGSPLILSALLFSLLMRRRRWPGSDRELRSEEPS